MTRASLLEELKELYVMAARARGEVLVVVLSDHGEGLGEHGERVHGFFVYETTLRVPLLLRGPGIPAGSRLGVTTRTVDLMPTLLARWQQHSRSLSTVS